MGLHNEKHGNARVNGFGEELLYPKQWHLGVNVFFNVEETPKTTDLFGSNMKASFQGLRNVNFQNILRLMPLVLLLPPQHHSFPFLPLPHLRAHPQV